MKFIASWLLPLAMAFLPFSKGLMQVEVSVITFNPYNLCMVLFACIAPILKIIYQNTRYKLSVTDLIIIPLCLVYFFSILFSESLIESGYVAFHALFIPVISYFVIKCYITSEKQIHRMFYFYILGLYSFGVVQLIYFLRTYSRTIVFDMNPIDFSTLCIVGILYLMFGRGIKKISTSFMLAPLLVFLFANLPRAYLMALTISPVLYLFIRKGKAAVLIVCFLSGTLAFTFILSTNAKNLRVSESQAIRGDAVNGIERIANPIYWKQSFYNRAMHFKDGLKTFSKSPILGQGISTGKRRFSWQHTFFTWHNFNLEWLVFSGIVGYLLYSSVFISNFIAAGSGARSDKLLATALLSITVIMINCTTNGIMHGMMPLAIFILLGISESRIRAKTLHLPLHNPNIVATA